MPLSAYLPAVRVQWQDEKASLVASSRRFLQSCVPRRLVASSHVREPALYAQAVRNLRTAWSSKQLEQNVTEMSKWVSYTPASSHWPYNAKIEPTSKTS